MHNIKLLIKVIIAGIILEALFLLTVFLYSKWEYKKAAEIQRQEYFEKKYKEDQEMPLE